MIGWILEQFFGNELKRETGRFLHELMHAQTAASRENATRLFSRIASGPGAKVELGHTLWNAPVTLPLDVLLRSHGLITGATGAGKTMAALIIIKALIDQMPYTDAGFAVLDVSKPDLSIGTCFLLLRRLEYLRTHDPAAAKDLRHRIIISDRSSRDPVSSHNILARHPDVEPDFFASNRADLLLDLLPGGEQPSLAGQALLQKTIRLLSECALPITFLSDVLQETGLRERLLAGCPNRAAASQFARQFSMVPPSTMAALCRRVEALLVSQSVRLALAGTTAPDFVKIQEEGKIFVARCCGEHISHSAGHVLQALDFCDIHQAVFRRRRKDQPFLWFLDESQNFFQTPDLCGLVGDLVCRARSYASFFCFLTQNLSASVPDGRLLKQFHTNLGWVFAMRTEPADCAFLKPVLPVTGRRTRPISHPFEEPRVHSVSEERAIVLDEILNLADRTGYLWLKGRMAEALQVRTRELDIPQDQDLEEATRSIRRDATIGMRMSRKEYERRIAERDAAWLSEAQGDLSLVLQQAYQGSRGERSKIAQR